MKLDNLKLFVHTLKEGSITGAAGKLGMAKSSLSRHLTELEAEFNIRLLNRRPRNLTATEAGQLLFDQLQPLMEGLDEVSHFMEHWREEPRGSLTMLLPLEFFNEDMGELTVEFIQAYKDIKLNVSHYSGPLPDNSADFDLCFALHDRPLPASDLIARSLMSVPQGIYGGAHCAAYCGEKAGFDDLSQLSSAQVILQPGERDWLFRSQAGTISVPVSGRLTMSSQQMSIVAAIRGLGLVKLPCYLAEQQVRQGTLRQIHTPLPLEAQSVSVVYPGRVMPRKSRALLEFIQDNIGRLHSKI